MVGRLDHFYNYSGMAWYNSKTDRVEMILVAIALNIRAQAFQDPARFFFPKDRPLQPLYGRW
jgi:hypothetical protein